MKPALGTRQRAQIIIVAPFAIIALVSVLGLVVDFGMFRLIDSELENAADAAALAAVWYDPVCPYYDATAVPPTGDPRCAPDNAPNKATIVAQTFAGYNLGLASGLCGSAPTVDAPHIHQIQQPKTFGLTIVIHCQAGYLAGRLLGLGSLQISRWGTAAIGDKDPITGQMLDYAPPSIGTPSLVAGLVPL